MASAKVYRRACLAPSSSGLGHRPFTPGTRVRVPSGSLFLLCRSFLLWLPADRRGSCCTLSLRARRLACLQAIPVLPILPILPQTARDHGSTCAALPRVFLIWLCPAARNARPHRVRWLFLAHLKKCVVRKPGSAAYICGKVWSLHEYAGR